MVSLSVHLVLDTPKEADERARTTDTRLALPAKVILIGMLILIGALFVGNGTPVYASSVVLTITLTTLVRTGVTIG